MAAKRRKTSAKKLSPQQLDRAFNKALTHFAGRDEVTGVDIGYRVKDGVRTDEVTLRIHLREKLPRRQVGTRMLIPKAFDGVPTDVIEARYEPQGGTTTVVAPAAATGVRPGTSLGVHGGPPGTLGLVVRAQNVQYDCLLSARHILAPPNTVPGTPVFAPSPADDALMATQVARLLRRGAYTDSALAMLAPGVPVDPRQEPTGVVLIGTGEPVLGMRLEKCGRTTDVTRGIVDGIGSYGSTAFSFRVVPEANGHAHFCLPGDSGAVWYDPVTARAIGLHVMGPANISVRPAYGIAHRIRVVLNDLKCALIPPAQV